MVNDDCLKYLFDLGNKLDGIIILECKVRILQIERKLYYLISGNYK